VFPRILLSYTRSSGNGFGYTGDNTRSFLHDAVSGQEWTEKGTGMTKAIIVDDEEDIRIALKDIFTRAGFEVEVASNGNEGMNLLRRHGADLVIIDIIMPGSDGVETARNIRMEFPKTKIIVMSGGGNAASLGYEPAAIKTTAYLASAAAIGADLTLTKPFDREKLIRVAKELTAH